MDARYVSRATGENPECVEKKDFVEGQQPRARRPSPEAPPTASKAIEKMLGLLLYVLGTMF